ncbi:PLL family lectin [Streptomyces sp. L500]
MHTHPARALAACSPGHGRLHLFVGAGDGSVRHRTFDGRWHAWHALDRPWPTPGAPGFNWLSATAVAGRPVELFALSAAGELWRLRPGAEERPRWSSLGTLARGRAATGFTVVPSRPGEVHLVLDTGADGWELLHAHPTKGPMVLRTGERPSGHLAATATAPGRVDLLLADPCGHRLLRAHLESDTPGTRQPPAWETLGPLPDCDEHSLTCLAATESDVFLGDHGLHHSALAPWLGWEQLGGDLTAPDPTVPRLAALASGGGRTDVLAVWAGAALMHRRYDRGWQDWQLLDLPEASTDSYPVLRPEDLVTLTVRSRGLHQQTLPDGTVQLVADPGGGHLLVDVPPQHLAETVVESGQPPQGFLAGPSTLCFAVGPDPVTLTVAGLLDAMNRLPLLIEAATTADLPARLEIPWNLLLTLQPDARCTHRTLPSTGTAGGTELWHSRIAGPDGHLTAHPLRSLADGTDHGTPLDTWYEQIVTAAAQNPGIPLTVDRLVLSAFGARFSAAAHWPQLEWAHDAALGRDFHVKVSVPGALFPFGHRAAYIEVSDRRFDGTNPAVAALHRKAFLIVTEPVRDDYGIGEGGPHERAFPFQRIAIDPGQTEGLDDAHWLPVDSSSTPPRCFWPARARVPVVFTLQARAGRQDVELHLPLLFVEDAATGAAYGALLDGIYGHGPVTGAFAGAFDGTGRPLSDIAARIPLAMASATQAIEDTVQEVQSMTFGGLGAGLSPSGVGFYPQVTQLAVGLPAVRQLLGPLPALPATLTRKLLDTHWGSPIPDALLDLVPPHPLDFGAAGARVGGLAAPNMLVSQVSRKLGPTVSDAFQTDPTKLFAPDASLFGVVPLSELIQTVTEPPKLLWQQPTTDRSADLAGQDTPNPSAELTWHQDLLKPHPPFQPGADCALDLDVRAHLVDGKPEMHARGTISNFQLIVPDQSASAYITLAFRSVTFTADPGKRLDLSVHLTDVTLGGDLGFLATLQKYLRFGDNGPHIDPSATSITASYTVAVPSIGLLVFSVQNLTVQAGVTLSLTDQPILLDFAFGTRERPFLVTVSGFGGGGYLELGVSAGGTDSGLQRFTGGIEFGAAIVMDFVIVSAEVHVFGGVVFVKDGKHTEVTGYLRVGGSISLLGLITVSIELTLALTWDADAGSLSGSARLVITVDLTFFSKSFTLECHKCFGNCPSSARPRGALPGAATAADPSVRAALGPQGQSFPWQTYCRAFARE